MKVIDLKTNEVIAERVGFMMDRGLGSKAGFRSPWGFAEQTACPLFPAIGPSDSRRRRSGAETSEFVTRVLKPNKGKIGYATNTATTYLTFANIQMAAEALLDRFPFTTEAGLIDVLKLGSYRSSNGAERPEIACLTPQNALSRSADPTSRHYPQLHRLASPRKRGCADSP